MAWCSALRAASTSVLDPIGGGPLGGAPLVERKRQPLQTHQVLDDRTAGSRSSTAPYTGTAFIYLWGGGGSGRWGSGGKGGGGAGATYMRVRVVRGQIIPYTIGAAGTQAGSDGTDGSDGGDSTLTTPGRAMTAGGGKAGTASAGAGGTASGGDTNVSGTTADGSGNGGASASFSATTGVLGSSGTPVVSSSGVAVLTPQFGGGSGNQGNAFGIAAPGGAGRVLIIYTRALL